jgi:hypothetical protein
VQSREERVAESPFRVSGGARGASLFVAEEKKRFSRFSLCHSKPEKKSSRLRKTALAKRARSRMGNHPGRAFF